jgi:hypothetical protein
MILIVEALDDRFVQRFWEFIGDVSAAVRKKMLQEQLNFHLYVNNVFASVRERATFGSGAINGASNIRYDETSVGLSLHFHFKKGKQKEMTDRSIEESKRINF